MMKFSGKWDVGNVPIRRQSKNWDKHKRPQEWDIPTVDEMDEFNAPGAADTILQILRGQGIYWGYDVESFAENGQEMRGRGKAKPIDHRQFLNTPEKVKPIKPLKKERVYQARIESKRIRVEQNARKLATRVMEEHWRAIERRWVGPVVMHGQMLTRKQRFFYHACLARGYNKESAFALARQFLPTTTKGKPNDKARDSRESDRKELR
jgi:hypothetical protein